MSTGEDPSSTSLSSERDHPLVIKSPGEGSPRRSKRLRMKRAQTDATSPPSTSFEQGVSRSAPSAVKEQNTEPQNVQNQKYTHLRPLLDNLDLRDKPAAVSRGKPGKNPGSSFSGITSNEPLQVNESLGSRPSREAVKNRDPQHQIKSKRKLAVDGQSKLVAVPSCSYAPGNTEQPGEEADDWQNPRAESWSQISEISQDSSGEWIKPKTAMQWAALAT